MVLALKKAKLSEKKKTVNYLILSLIFSLFFAFFNLEAGVNIINKEML